MTKVELIEAIKDYPEDTEIGLMYNGGDSCGLDLMEFFNSDGSKDTQNIILKPDVDAPIANN